MAIRVWRHHAAFRGRAARAGRRASFGVAPKFTTTHDARASETPGCPCATVAGLSLE